MPSTELVECYGSEAIAFWAQGEKEVEKCQLNSIHQEENIYHEVLPLDENSGNIYVLKLRCDLIRNKILERVTHLQKMGITLSPLSLDKAWRATGGAQVQNKNDAIKYMALVLNSAVEADVISNFV